MKKNKTQISLLLSMLALVAMVWGCKDNTDFRKVRNEALTNLQRGGMIQFENLRERMILSGADPNTGQFSAPIVDPNGTAVLYTVGVVTATDTVQVASYTSFPTNLVIQAADIRTAIGRDLEFGESFDFFGEVTTEDGTVYNANVLDVSTDNGVTTVSGGNSRFEIFQPANTGLKQAFVFELTVACPEPADIAADLVGTWEITTNGNYPSSTTPRIEGRIVTIVAGPEENQFTIQDWWTDGRDYIVTHDPETDALTSDRQETWPHPSFGLILPQITSGSAFGCAGIIKMTTRHFLADGRAFSRRPIMTLTKQ